MTSSKINTILAPREIERINIEIGEDKFLIFEDIGSIKFCKIISQKLVANEDIMDIEKEIDGIIDSRDISIFIDSLKIIQKRIDERN